MASLLASDKTSDLYVVIDLLTLKIMQLSWLTGKKKCASFKLEMTRIIFLLLLLSGEDKNMVPLGLQGFFFSNFLNYLVL